jgi:hypothetical protein
MGGGEVGTVGAVGDVVPPLHPAMSAIMSGSRSRRSILDFSRNHPMIVDSRPHLTGLSS